MCVDVRVVDWLRREGHDATHLRELGLFGLPDPAIFAKAAEEGRTVLTFDLDFGEIAAASGGRTGVVVLRLRNTRLLHVVERLRATLPEASSALERGAVVTVEESRHRIRYFPGGGTGDP